MKRVQVNFGTRRVGEILAEDGIHYFSYDREYLRQPLPLSPYQLPPIAGVSAHSEGAFLTLPCLCYDSLPDRFGMAVLRRSFRDKGVLNPSPLQMLSFVGDRSMGALCYQPAEDEFAQASSVDLVKAAQSANGIIEFEHGAELDPAIARAGVSAGGAKPKLLAAMAADNSEIITGTHRIPEGMGAWLIKLNTESKKHASLIQLEHAYLAMAKAAGLRVPETRLLRDKDGTQHLAVRRFDRSLHDPNRRIHTQTYSAIAGIPFQEPTADYEDLLRLTASLTRNHEDVCEQYSRMVFNVFACNRDDHAKNFSFCMSDSGEWTVSPAYDLLFTDTDLGGNWMMVQGKRSRITADDLLRLADLMGISRSHFNQMVERINDALSHWPGYAKASGVGPGLSKVVEMNLAERSTGS